MEQLASERGREILRGVVQLSLDMQAAAEVRLPAVTGADEVPRTRAERGHSLTVVTTLGAVTVRRIAYRSGVKGVPSLFPRDAVLNLPPCGYSWQLRRLAEIFGRSGSYEQARGFVLAATGVSVGKRQLEQVTARAAADAERFGQDHGGCRDRAVPGAGQQDLPPLAISADGKGVVVSIKNSAGVQVGDHNTQVNNYGGVTAGHDAYVAGRDMTITRASSEESANSPD